jgi:hypothetical protein
MSCVCAMHFVQQVINRSPQYKNKYVHRRTSVSLENLTTTQVNIFACLSPSAHERAQLMNVDLHLRSKNVPIASVRHCVLFLAHPCSNLPCSSCVPPLMY